MVNADIPKEWVVKTIAQLGNYNPATVQTGPFGAQLHSSDYVDEGVPFILIKNLQDGGLDTTDMPHITYQDAHRLSLYALQTGDVVFSRVGRVGSCFLVEKEQEGWMISGQMLRIRLPSDAIDRHYLIHALRSKPAQDRITGVSVGSTRQSINTQILESLKVLVPSLPEQHRIAEILDAADDAIRQTERVIVKLRQAKAGLLHDLLTRGLDAQDRLRDPTAHPEQFKDSSLGRIPREWEITTLLDVAVGGISNGYFKKPSLVGSGYRLVNVLDLYQEFGIDLELVERVEASEQDWLRYAAKPGDCFFTRSSLNLAGIAHCNIIRDVPEPAVFECHVMRVRPNRNRVVPEFFAHWCRSAWVRSFFMERARQVTMTTIAQSDLAPLPVPLPTILEQQRIIETLDAADARIRVEEATLAKLQQVKRGLMDDLLTGRVRV